MSDRGYRDEVGAAVERLEQLQEENALLRAELDRLDAPKRRLARERSARVVVLALCGLVIAGVGAYSHGTPGPHRPRHRHHSFAPQRTPLDARARGRSYEANAQPDRMNTAPLDLSVMPPEYDDGL